jgi:MFS family permease
VPSLAFVGGLGLAATLVIAERLGKAIRTPSRDIMLAQAGTSIGRGWAFALHEAADQLGAFAGPLLVAGALYESGYRLGFGMLAIPGALAILLLFWLRAKVPHPELYEHDEPGPKPDGNGRLGSAFWTYAAFSGLVMLGFSTFAVVGFHLSHEHLVSVALVPVVYATAMAADALSALVSGRRYDRVGIRTLVWLPVLAALVPWLAFQNVAWVAWMGALMWGAALGLQEATLRAAVADLVPRERRGTAYGIFTAIYGGAWLGGSAMTGLLYEHSRMLLGVVVTAVQVVALAVLLLVVFPRHE